MYIFSISINHKSNFPYKKYSLLVITLQNGCRKLVVVKIDKTVPCVMFYSQVRILRVIDVLLFFTK